MAKYHVALIGTGRVGYQFSFSDLPDNHAEAIVQSEACELVAGVNRGKEKLEAFGARFSVDALFHDHEEMLREVQPDICVVATHPELHCEMVVGCAEASSTRAIICEKPMALSLDECDRMIEACESRGVLLQINHNRRWYPEWTLALQLIRDGAIGELNNIYCYLDGCKPIPSWRSEHEGPLLHDSTHYFDLIDFYAGEVDWLCGMAEQRRRPWAVEDFSAAFMKFKSGATGVMYGAELTEYTDCAFELRGTKGVIRMIEEQVCLYQSERDVYEPDSGFQWSSLKPKEVPRPEAVSSYVLALKELIQVLRGDAVLRSDGQTGRRSIEMITAIYQSQLEGNRPVRFPVEMEGSGVAALREAGVFREGARE